MPGARTRRALWIDYTTGSGVDSDGQAVKPVIGGRRKTPNLTDLLDTAAATGTERVYLTGARPAAKWMETHTPGWKPGGHHRDTDTPVGRFTHTLTGARVELRRAHEWFGEGAYSPREAREAFALLGAVYARAFRGAPLLASPTVTGRDGWARSLPDGDLLQLDADTAALVRATSPQHRVELCTVRHDDADPREDRPVCTADELPGFVYLDGRTMYAALTRELGVAPVTHLHGDAARAHADTDTYARARYRVTCTVPRDWTHIGVLMVKRGERTWGAPNVPGAPVHTWCDAAELHVARAAGWTVDVHEALVFTKGGRPLDTWTKRVLRARDDAAGADADPTTRALAAGAMRSLLVRTIGTFQNAGHATLHVSDNYAEAVQRAGDAPVEDIGGGLYRWTTHTALTGAAARWYHPEFTSQVWGRSHARLLDSPTADRLRNGGALYVQPHEVVGVRGDALYLTRDPQWADDGRVGRLRVKGTIAGPLPAPRTPSAWNTLRAQAERNSA